MGPGGGVGLGHLELCVIAEELGRVVAPVPMVSSIYLAAEFLMVAGSQAQKEAWLPKLASGEAIGTFALAEGVGRVTETLIKATVTGGKLSGTKVPVPDGDVADLCVVVARSGGQVTLTATVDGAGYPEFARERFVLVLHGVSAREVEVDLDGTRLRLEPGQSVIPHGIDRELTPDEIASRGQA